MESIGIIQNLFPLVGEYEYNYALQKVFDDEHLISNKLVEQMCQGLSRGALSNQIIEYLDGENPFTTLEDLRCAGLKGYIAIFEKPNTSWNSRFMKAFYFREFHEVFDSFEKWCEE